MIWWNSLANTDVHTCIQIFPHTNGHTSTHTNILTLKKSLIAKCKNPAKTTMKKTAKRLPMMSLFLSCKAAETFPLAPHQCLPHHPPHPINVPLAPSPSVYFPTHLHKRKQSWLEFCQYIVLHVTHVYPHIIVLHVTHVYPHYSTTCNSCAVYEIPTQLLQMLGSWK